MTALATIAPALLAEPEDLFPDVSGPGLKTLLEEYAELRGQMERIASWASESIHDEALRLFLRGNYGGDGREGSAIRSVTRKAFQIEGGLKALDADYWKRALDLTDVFQIMNQDRRNEWHKQFEDLNVVEFSAANLALTLGDLLGKRMEFFAERVDGIFRRLSGEHVTNCPQGFNRRMILGCMFQYGSPSTAACGYISDLRSVIAKFMGREEPGYTTSTPLVEAGLRQHGQWMDVDGGAFRLRVYLKGTAHIEVHPDMARRLNQVLASKYPRAIASEHRTRSEKPVKGWAPMQRPLPWPVVDLIAQASRRGKHYAGRSVIDLGYHYGDGKPAHKEAVRVLEYLGAVSTGDGFVFEFPYQAGDVLDLLVASGCIPDAVSHQYYPTPALVADEAIAMLGATPEDEVLEPSAGQGALAERLPNREKVTCVELSELHAAVLSGKGFGYVLAGVDFLEWAKTTAQRFDKVIQNPPFSEGRHLLHLRAAAGLLKPGGRLVSVLPASAKGKDVLPGFALQWSEVFVDEFDGTGVSVVIVAAERAGDA